MCQAVDWTCVNKRVLESLAKSGALDGLGGRSAVLGDLDRSIAAGQSHHRALARGQIGLFGAMDASPVETARVAAYPELPSKQLLAMEKEFLGLYLSDHPLTDILGRR
jgi:DNA polymerase-3 subunit alpha